MKKTLYTVLILLLTFIFVMGLVACVDPDFDDEKIEPVAEALVRTQLIKNGTFYDTSNNTGSKKYIKENVAGWELMTGSVSNATDGVIFGGIDLSKQELFEAEKKNISINNTLAYPGIDPKTPFEKDEPTLRQDTNALLLASTKKAGSIYYKNSSDFVLQAKTYYKLQFSVLTDIDLTDVDEADQSKKGAWVTIDGAVYAEFPTINTNGTWQTFEVYIEGSDFDATRTIKVRLWLGNGPDQIKSVTNVYLTKGAVLFDNVICEEIEKSVYDDSTVTATTKKTTMLYPDMNFEQQSEMFVSSDPDYFYSFRSGTNSSNNAVNYTLVEGKTGLTANKPPIDKPFTGIVDLSKMYRFDSTKTGAEQFINTYKVDHNKSTFVAPERSNFMNNEGILNLVAGREDAVDGKLSEYKALMIYHDDLSGAGFKSNKQLLIKKNTFYTIKVWAYVWSIPLPEPSKAEVGEEPVVPAGITRPEQVSIDAAEAAKIVAEAEYNYRRILAELITDDDLTPAQLEAIGELSEGRKTEVADLAVADLQAVYDDLKKEYDDLILDKGKWDSYDEKFATYTTKVNDYMSKYWDWRDANSELTGEDAFDLQPYAKFKITGAGDLEAEKTTQVGKWEELEFCINGNQLSDRKVNLEFWFGEGSNIDYADLMLGGVFFDNVTIIESATPSTGKSYQELSPFTAEDLTSGNVDVGELIDTTSDIKFSDDATLDENDLWEKELGAGTATIDSELLNFEIIDDETYPIRINDETKYYSLLRMQNLDYTASILNFRGEREILANKTYRLSFWAKTKDIDKELGATMSLMVKEKGSADDMSSASSFTSFNFDEWQEVVFYIKGDTLKNNLVSLNFKLGSGNRFDTSSYIKGSLLISAITMKEIEFSEYNASTKSGDQTKSYAFNNTASASSSSVTNANFGGIELADIKKDAINDKGELVGVAPTSSWSIPSESSITTNGYNKPVGEDSSTKPDLKKLIDDKYYLVWKHTEDANGNKPDGYEIYILNTIDEDEKDVDSLYIGYVATGDKYKEVGQGESEEWYYRFEIKSKAKGNFVVRAVSASGVGTKSDVVANNVSGEGYDAVFTKYTTVPKKEYNIGTINYKTYNKTYTDDEEKTAIDGPYKDIFADSTYISPYSTMLMINSNYGIRANVTAASKSLAATSFFEISVWMKTIDGAKGSISFKDISEILESRDENVGYTNLDTQGKWVQYRFYIATGAQSSNIELMLSMGNPYGRGTPGTENETTKMYDNNVLSSGTIFFDNVNIVTLSEEQYKTKSTAKKDENTEGEYFAGNKVYLSYEMVYANEFAYKVLEYTTDSFDSYTENTVIDEFDSTGKYNEGFYRGQTPNAYSWARATDGATTDYERLYGVYSYKNIKSNDHPLLTNDTHPDPFAAFLPTNFDLATFIQINGYNSLVMSNLISNGQRYTLTNTRVLSANTYYKLTFKAKTLLAEGKTAEFRYLYEGSDDDYKTISLSSAGKSIDEYIEYEMYIYNDEDITKSIKWSFSLGGDSEDSKVLGMLVIDDVKLVTIDGTEFVDAQRDFDALTPDSQKLSATQFYTYTPEDSDPGNNNEPDEPAPPKTGIFDRGDVWLLVSTVVIGGVILLTVIVVLIRRFKKKHPKKVKGENMVKTEKTIEFIPTKPSEKEDVENEEEFVDKEEKPKYVQRVLPKKKKK